MISRDLRLHGTRPGWGTWGCMEGPENAPYTWWGLMGVGPAGSGSHTILRHMQMGETWPWIPRCAPDSDRKKIFIYILLIFFHFCHFCYRERANNIKIFPIINSPVMCTNFVHWATSCIIMRLTQCEKRLNFNILPPNSQSQTMAGISGFDNQEIYKEHTVFLHWTCQS